MVLLYESMLEYTLHFTEEHVTIADKENNLQRGVFKL